MLAYLNIVSSDEIKGTKEPRMSSGTEILAEDAKAVANAAAAPAWISSSVALNFCLLCAGKGSMVRCWINLEVRRSSAAKKIGGTKTGRTRRGSHAFYGQGLKNSARLLQFEVTP